MQDFDELLNSLGVHIPDEPVNIRADSSISPVVDNTTLPASPDPPARELSEEDISEIFENNGYQETPEADAEEIIEEEEDFAFDVEPTADDSESEHPLVPNYVGTRENAVNAGDCYVNPDTDAIEMLDFDGRPIRIADATSQVDTTNLEDNAGVSVIDPTRVMIENPAIEDYPIQIEASHGDTNTTVEETEIQDVPFEDETSSEDAPLIPENSPTLVMDDSTSRFSGAEWYNSIQTQRVILAGLGGIGSNVALQIARLHPRTIVMYDPDIVETVNMSGQLFRNRDVGAHKVNAVLDVVNEFVNINGIDIFNRNKRFTANEESGAIMICGFDNMEARRIFFEAWKGYVEARYYPEDKEKCLFIDGRLSIDTLQVLCMRGDDEYHIKEYEDKYLFTDEEADETICSMKQTTYMACMIGSIMTNLFTNFVAGTLHPAIPYNLPFFTEYEAQSMKFKTENQWHL